MPTVAVKPELIRWAIKRSGLPTEELREKFPKLDEWLAGEKQPTFRQLEQFARKTMTPLGTLFLDAPPHEELPVPDFRTHHDKPLKRFSPNLIDTIRTMQQRQAWMREWLVDEGADELDFVGCLSVVPRSVLGWRREAGDGRKRWAAQKVVEHPETANPNHADVTNFPPAKEDQQALAVKLAAAASKRIAPPDSS